MVGRTSRNLNANDALWTFFNAHRRAPQSRP
jgi:poly(3-hydroxybutyrate) depolymerase